MKTLLFLSLFMVTQVIHAQKLKVVLYNKTGYDLDSVYLQDKYVGQIKKDGFAKVPNCKEVMMQVNQPVAAPNATIKGKLRAPEVMEGLICGTGLHTVKSGVYKFDITMYDGAQGYVLCWAQHE